MSREFDYFYSQAVQKVVSQEHMQQAFEIVMGRYPTDERLQGFKPEASLSKEDRGELDKGRVSPERLTGLRQQYADDPVALQELGLHVLHTLEEIAEEVGYHPGTLRNLVRDGEIDGVKVGHPDKGIWLTTVKNVIKYKKNVKMGRPRKSSES